MSESRNRPMVAPVEAGPERMGSGDGWPDAPRPVQHPHPQTPASFLEEASRLVSVDRAASHGPYLENHQNIAHLWTGWLKARHRADFALTPDDVSTMMSLLKKCRQISGDYNADDYVDDMAYTAISGAIRSNRA